MLPPDVFDLVARSRAEMKRLRRGRIHRVREKLNEVGEPKWATTTDVIVDLDREREVRLERQQISDLEMAEKGTRVFLTTRVAYTMSVLSSVAQNGELSPNPWSGEVGGTAYRWTRTEMSDEETEVARARILSTFEDIAAQLAAVDEPEAIIEISRPSSGQVELLVRGATGYFARLLNLEVEIARLRRDNPTGVAAMEPSLKIKIDSATARITASECAYRADPSSGELVRERLSLYGLDGPVLIEEPAAEELFPAPAARVVRLVKIETKHFLLLTFEIDGGTRAEMMSRSEGGAHPYLVPAIGEPVELRVLRVIGEATTAEALLSISSDRGSLFDRIIDDNDPLYNKTVELAGKEPEPGNDAVEIEELAGTVSAISDLGLERVLVCRDQEGDSEWSVKVHDRQFEQLSSLLGSSGILYFTRPYGLLEPGYVTTTAGVMVAGETPEL